MPNQYIEVLDFEDMKILGNFSFVVLDLYVIEDSDPFHGGTWSNP